MPQVQAVTIRAGSRWNFFSISRGQRLPLSWCARGCTRKMAAAGGDALLPLRRLLPFFSRLSPSVTICWQFKTPSRPTRASAASRLRPMVASHFLPSSRQRSRRQCIRASLLRISGSRRRQLNSCQNSTTPGCPGSRIAPLPQPDPLASPHSCPSIALLTPPCRPRRMVVYEKDPCSISRPHMRAARLCSVFTLAAGAADGRRTTGPQLGPGQDPL